MSAVLIATVVVWLSCANKTANGLRLTKAFDSDGQVCTIRIEPRRWSKTITDKELNEALEQLVPEKERGKFVMGTFLNIICIESNGKEIRESKEVCHGVSDRYERLTIARMGNTNSYDHVDIRYLRPSCDRIAQAR